MAAPAYREEELGRKWDKCIYDGILKFGGGLAVGAVGSLLFFKRRAWPLLLGSGFGFGLAYGNCEKEIQSTLSSKCLKHKTPSVSAHSVSDKVPCH